MPRVAAAGAVEFIRRVLLAAGAPVTLIATGPLTNVAALLLAHPEVAGIAAMG